VSEHKKPGFFDLKRNLTGLVAVVAVITVAGWYFGFSWNDVGDVAESVATVTKPELPVKVNYRQSMVGKGYVAIIKNMAGQPLAVEIDLRDPSAANKKRELKTLNPNKELSIGWLEGWEFKAGDVIKISNPEFQTGVYAIK